MNAHKIQNKTQLIIDFLSRGSEIDLSRQVKLLRHGPICIFWKSKTGAARLAQGRPEVRALERAASYFGPVCLLYAAAKDEISATVEGPKRNPPGGISVRFREPAGRQPLSVTVNGEPWKQLQGEWVKLPGNIGTAKIVARYGKNNDISNLALNEPSQLAKRMSRNRTTGL